MSIDFDNLKLTRYRPERQLAVDSTVLVVGQRFSGKTVIMRYLLYCIAKKLDLCLAWVPTDDTREEFERCIPKCFVYPEHNKEDLDRICETQKTLNKACGGKKEGNLRRIGIVLDDCNYDKKMFENKTMRYLLMNGRHDNFFFMNGCQYVMTFPKDLRSQISLAIVFPDPNPKTRNATRENLLGCFPDDEKLMRVFDSLQSHEALVFDQNAFRKKERCLYYMKAKYPLPEFTVGSPLFWSLYYAHFIRESTADIKHQITTTVQAAQGKFTGLQETAEIKRHTGVQRIEDDEDDEENAGHPGVRSHQPSHPGVRSHHPSHPSHPSRTPPPMLKPLPAKPRPKAGPGGSAAKRRPPVLPALPPLPSGMG